MKFIHSLILIIALLPLTLGGFYIPAAAQSSGEDWQPPINLSNSGGVSNPTVVVDSNSVVHAFWEDLYAEMVYSRRVGEEWSRPINLDLPFYNTAYTLLADRNGRLYAFWLDTDNSFVFSRVNAENAGNSQSWLPAVQLARGVVAYDVSVDANNRVYAAFVYAEVDAENPSGVYVLSTLQDSISWSTPRLIYASRYYRTLLPPPGTSLPPGSAVRQLTRISISARVEGSSSTVAVGWDDAALRRSYYAVSTNGGVEFTEPVLLDGPETLPAYLEPRNVDVHFDDSGLLILWERSDPLGESCTQRFLFSADAGQSWQSEGGLWADFGLCPESMSFLNTETPSLAFSRVQGQVFLRAFSAGQWSRAQNQIALNDLYNPDTLDVIDFGCVQGALLGDELIVIGCDRGSSGDIWVTSRKLDPLTGWFEQRSGWAFPERVFAGYAEIHNIKVTGGSGDSVNLIWFGSEAEVTADEVPGLQAAAWRNNSLLGPIQIHRISVGIPENLSVLYLPDSQRLLTAWQAGRDGEVFSSWTSADDIINRTNWSAPDLVQANNPQGLYPVLVQGQENVGYLIYAIPYNEDRGIYLVESVDGGVTWGERKAVVGSADITCPGFTNPSASIFAETIHILFTCSTLPGGVGPQSLYYLRSTDSGRTWSDVQQVADQQVTWSRIFAINENLVYRVWKDSQPGSDRLWFSISNDQGINWMQPMNFFTSETELSRLDMDADPAGGLHLAMALQIGENSSPRLEYLHWKGENWQRGQSLEIDRTTLNSVTALSIQIINNAQLAVGLAGRVRNEQTGTIESRILYSALPVEIAAAPVDIQVPLVTPTTEIEVEETPTAQPAVTLDFSRQPGSSSAPPWMGIAAGGVLAAGVITGALVYARVLRRKIK